MNTIPPPVSVRSLLACTLLLAACGGGGGTDPALQVRGNLTVASARIISSTQHAGHEVRVGVTVASTTTYNDVPVAFVLLNKADYDSQATDIRQHEVATMVFPAIAEGSAEYVADVRLPVEAREATAYYLVPHLDPANAIRETDEDDNEPRDGSHIEVTVGNSNTDRCDIVLESATIQEDAVVLREPTTLDPTAFGINNEEDPDFYASIVMTGTGALMLTAVDIEATIEVPGSGRMAVRAWRSSAGNWQNRDYAPMTPAEPTNVQYELSFPSSTRAAIRAHLQAAAGNVFTVWFRANGASGHAQWEGGMNSITAPGNTDDEATDEIVIVLPGGTQPNPCNNIDWRAGYKQEWKNKYFGVGVDFSNRASLDEQGATAESVSRVPVKLFGIAADALSLRGYAHVLPRENQPTDSDFLIDFSVFGVSILHQESTDPQFVYDNSRTIVKTYERNGLVFAGPVPIQLRAVATGSVGYQFTATIDPARMSLMGRAFGQLSTLAEAKVNAIVASVGVVGSVDLLSDELRAEANCQLLPPANGRLQGVLTFQVTNELTGPQGRIYIYEQHVEPKWCYRVIPCGLRTVRNEKTLVKFNTFARRDVLLNKTLTSSVCL